MTAPLLDIAPRTDIAAQRAAFARDGRLQLRDVLTPESAQMLLHILGRETPWGLAWQAGGTGARHLRRDALATMPADDHRAISQQVGRAMAGEDYAFAYSCYPLVDAYKQRWAPDGPHDMLLEYLNDTAMLDLVRSVTGLDGIVKADAQATLYAPGQFLAMHNDLDPAGGRLVAYVLSLCPPGWRADWGGYLQFYDDDGDVVAGYRPRFNALNLFAVPMPHNVTQVASWAPVGRFSITGWFRDR